MHSPKLVLNVSYCIFSAWNLLERSLFLLFFYLSKVFKISVAPLSRPDQFGESESDPGCSDTTKNVAAPESGPIWLANPNRNPGDARLIPFIYILLSLLFQKFCDPNPQPDPNDGSKPKPGLLRHFQLSSQNIFFYVIKSLRKRFQFRASP